jgi:hypothetical protein
MNLDELVAKGWQDHAADPEGVLERLRGGVALVREPKDIPAISALIVHVSGEHLGRWNDGVALLEELERLPLFDRTTAEGKAVARGQAVLHRCAGRPDEAERCLEALSAPTGGDPAGQGGVPPSERIRVLAVAASALVGQKRLAEGARDFEEAVSLASYGPTSGDPAARSLAVTGHNLACELENRPALAPEEKELMLRAAFISRDFWAIAGGWMQAERAEYRLAMSHIKAGDPVTALAHARRCLAVVEENGADPGEAFFAHEAVARAMLAGGNGPGARAEREIMTGLLPKVPDDSLRQFCAEELEKLEADLPE